MTKYALDVTVTYTARVHVEAESSNEAEELVVEYVPGWIHVPDLDITLDLDGLETWES